ncbi:MAG: hypothetical protein Q4G69_03530 [Planctomycetia bacterium]|nr:hypothetical protein [Planctomycetia bacterium]
MKDSLILFVLFAVSLFSLSVNGASPESWKAKDIRRFSAEEAFQGVCSDDQYFYAIEDRSVGKYRKETGGRIRLWEAAPESGILHLNSAMAADGKIYMAHSNWPNTPMLSSIEILDAKSLEHIGNISFGILYGGSLTWITQRKDGTRFACFCNYTDRGGVPGRDSNWSFIARLDQNFRPVESWAFPKDLVQKFDGYGASGGTFAGEYLCVSGHALGEIYVLEFPGAGSVLKWKATITAPFKGQAIDWNDKDQKFYATDRTKKEVVVFGVEK